MGAGTAAVVGGAAGLYGAKRDRDRAKGAEKAAASEQAANREFIKEQAERSRKDALPLFDAAQQARLLGGQSGLDIFGAAIPAQAQAFQQGNVGAQEALLAGLPQFQNAILGMPIDYSAFQPRTITPDLSFLGQARLPEFQSAQSIFDAGQAAQDSQDQQTVADLLGGFKTDEDLFRAASMGEIPGLSPSDQDFWGRHLAEASKLGPFGSALITYPEAAKQNIVGQPGGFSPANEQAAARLLDILAGAQQ